MNRPGSLLASLGIAAGVILGCTTAPAATAPTSAPAAASAPTSAPAAASAPTSSPAVTPRAQTDIVDTAVAAGSFTTLAKLLTSAGLIDTLKGAGPFTVFAPTDEAFAKIDKATLDALAADPAKLKAVLTYHVVSGKVLAMDVKAGQVPTLASQSITVSLAGGTVMVNNAKVIKTDVIASNGVIHIIDTVLLPKS